MNLGEKEKKREEGTIMGKTPHILNEKTEDIT